MAAISRLGYLGFEVSDVAAWERFAVEALGLLVSERRSDGSVACRIDDQAQTSGTARSSTGPRSAATPSKGSPTGYR